MSVRVWVCESSGSAWPERFFNEEYDFDGPCTDAVEGGLFCGEMAYGEAVKRWPWVKDEVEE